MNLSTLPTLEKDMKALEMLSLLNFEWKMRHFPIMSSDAIHTIQKAVYTDNDAYSLSKCILDYFKFMGVNAVKIASLEKFNVQSGTWTKPPSSPDSMIILADISGFESSRHYVMVEITINNATRCHLELQVQAGGDCWTKIDASDFQTFYDWFENLKREGGFSC